MNGMIAIANHGIAMNGAAISTPRKVNGYIINCESHSVAISIIVLSVAPAGSRVVESVAH